jgi:5S rRNA maturation endonuclease (ribonuclease M5)
MRSFRNYLEKENDRANELKNIINSLNSEIDVIIVEGEKDRKALIKAGFKKEIIKCSSLSLAEIESKIFEISKNKKLRIAIFTDFDEKGKEMNKLFVSHLQSFGIKINSFYRNKIKEIMGEKKVIESLEKIL